MKRTANRPTTTTAAAIGTRSCASPPAAGVGDADGAGDTDGTGDRLGPDVADEEGEADRDGDAVADGEALGDAACAVKVNVPRSTPSSSAVTVVHSTV
jgi:hypothetical protein